MVLHSTLKYSDCIWLPSTEIDQQLHSYNKFQTEKQSELDLHKVFLRKLEQKEEEISNLKHKYESMKNTNTNRTTEVNSNIVHWSWTGGQRSHLGSGGGMAGELGFTLRAVDCHQDFREEIMQ